MPGAPQTLLRGPRLQVRRTPGRASVVLQGATVAAAVQPGYRRGLVDRLFAVPAIRSVGLDLRRGSVRLDLSDGGGAVGDALDALARSMKLTEVERLALNHEQLLGNRGGPGPVEIFRSGRGLTFWCVESVSDEVCRIRHPLLREDVFRDRVVEELATLPEVTMEAFPFHGVGPIRIRIRPHRFDPERLPEVLDPLVGSFIRPGQSADSGTRVDSWVNANLVLAPVSDYLFPPLGLANVVLVGAINRPHLRPAMEDLRSGRMGVELLYLCIGAATLLTFNFFAAATMYWFLRFWPKRIARLQRRHTARLLAGLRRSPRRVWVESGGLAVERQVGDLGPADVVILRAGDLIPGDGVAVGGRARVREGWVTGSGREVWKGAGDAVFGTGEVLEGELRLGVEAVNERTAAGKLSAWYVDQLERAAVRHQARARHFADRAVLPSLLVGLAALSRGGLPMTKAVIRPDYLTGVAAGERLGGLAVAIRAARQGILLVDTDRIESLVRAPCIVFDDSVPWTASDLSGVPAGPVEGSSGGRECIFLASGASTRAGELGFASVQTGFSESAKRAYIAQRQEFGATVVYVGDCHSQAAAAAQADFAISVLQAPFAAGIPSNPAILGADLSKVWRLLVLAEALAEERSFARRLVVVPNVAAVIGALFLGTSVAATVALTNFGSFAGYLRGQSQLMLTEFDDALTEALNRRAARA